MRSCHTDTSGFSVLTDNRNACGRITERRQLTFKPIDLLQSILLRIRGIYFAQYCGGVEGSVITNRGKIGVRGKKRGKGGEGIKKAKERRHPIKISFLVSAKLIFLGEGGGGIICFTCIIYTPTLIYTLLNS